VVCHPLGGSGILQNRKRPLRFLHLTVARDGLARLWACVFSVAAIGVSGNQDVGFR
jgi:hypothetical protein